MSVKTILTTFAIATGALALQAGDSYVPFDSKNACDACPSYDHSLSFGYDTDYIWRGTSAATDSIWGAVDLDLGGGLSVGAWYLEGLQNTPSALNGNPDGYEELNLYANYALPQILGFDASIGYVFYDFYTDVPGTTESTEHEVNISLSRDAFGGTIGYFGAKGFVNNTWYHEANYARSLGSFAGLDVNYDAALGYWHTSGTSGFSHHQHRLSTSLPIGCRLTINPYVAYIDSLVGGPTGGAAGAFPAGGAGDQWFGGVSATYGF